MPSRASSCVVDLGCDLLAHINSGWAPQAIRAACLLGVPDHLAAGPTDLAALAASTSSDAAALRRLLRALVTLDLCREADGDRFELTPAGALLRDDHPRSLRAWALQAGGPQAQRLWELAESVRSGHSWRRRHEGADGFDALARQPGPAAEFHRAMTELTRRVAADVLAVLDLHAARRVVDVGGGSGELLAAVLSEYPEARGVLVDQAHALAHAPARLAQAGVASRCECVAGSFFDPVPGDGDVYLLKSVLHNWDDERCETILRRCHAAMSADARVLVIERLMPERLASTAAHRELARSDLNMLAALSGRERTVQEFAALMARIGLTLIRTLHTSGAMSVLEARRA